MGAFESIHNDTAEPVEVWWQDLGGAAVDGNYDDQTLSPGDVTSAHQLSLDLAHQVCVKYTIKKETKQHHPEFTQPEYTIKKETKQVCKEEWSSKVPRRHTTYAVSDVIGKGTLPQYEGLSPVSVTNNPDSAICTWVALGVLLFLALVALPYIGKGIKKWMDSKIKGPKEAMDPLIEHYTKDQISGA